MMRRTAIVIVALASVLSFGGCSDDTSFDPGSSSILTMEDIYHHEITRLVGEDIVVETKIYWRLFVPGERQGENQADTLRASPLAILFENGDQFMPGRFRGQSRGDIRIVSPEIHKGVKPPGVETFYFGDRELRNGAAYRLIGSFKYRDVLSPPPVDSPQFIEQSNNPVYWSQTFEFQLERAVLLHWK